MIVVKVKLLKIKHSITWYWYQIKKGFCSFLWFAQYTSFTYTKQIYTYAINYLSTEAVALPCFQVREDICQMSIHRKLNKKQTTFCVVCSRAWNIRNTTKRPSCICEIWFTSVLHIWFRKNEIGFILGPEFHEIDPIISSTPFKKYSNNTLYTLYF